MLDYLEHEDYGFKNQIYFSHFLSPLYDFLRRMQPKHQQIPKLEFNIILNLGKIESLCHLQKFECYYSRLFLLSISPTLQFLPHLNLFDRFDLLIFLGIVAV